MIELNDALTNLNSAYENIKIYKSFNSYDTQRGFIHPGGLYTQEDFDRIKNQLYAGNEKVTSAFNILKEASYAQPTAATYPTEEIIRGISGQENYINAARGATIAFQNALRWRIEGNEDCAKHAIEVLMLWAKTTKRVTEIVTLL